MLSWSYPTWLIMISVVVFGLERLFAARKDQSPLRKTLSADLLHIVFNGHFLGTILFVLSARHLLPRLDALLAQMGIIDVLYRGVAGEWPVALQIVIALVVIDFCQWWIHRLLHRVPWLWRFHQVHHSVKDGEMDFWVAFRFSWVEVVVYKALQYFPLAWLGFSTEAIMFHAVFGTLIGHLNHANLDWDYGPLRYVLNNPKMHLWHHDFDGPTTGRNFGIIFSCWDYLAGTAYVGDGPPRKLGFEGVDDVPTSFFAQEVWPFTSRLPVDVLIGAALLTMGWLATY